jgi:hypothetical protein
MSHGSSSYTSRHVPEAVKRIFWAVYGQTPAGRREKRILTNPDVLRGLELTRPELEKMRKGWVDLDRQRAYDRLYTYDDMHGDDR